MKKYSLIILFLLAGIPVLFAQANNSGNINVQVGLGISPTYFSDIAEVESQPIHFSADYSIFSFLSAGLGWSLASSNELSSYQNTPASLVSSFNTFSLRGNAHLPLFDRLDVYAGGSVGVQRVVEVYREISGGQPLPSGIESTKLAVFQPEGHVGLRWRLLGNIGLYAEGGYGLSLVQAGLNMKL